MLDFTNPFRSLARSPFLVGAAISTLALSAGLNVAVFGLIDRALFSAPGHLTDPGRVFSLAFGGPDERGSPADDPDAMMTSVSYVAFNTLSTQVPAITGAAAYQRTAATFIQNGEQRNVSAMLVSSGYFDLLGTRPFLGRGLGTADDEAGSVAPAAILSHAFWRTTLGGDERAIGKKAHITGIEYTIAGIMPEGFSGHSTANVDVFMPFAAAMRATPGWDREAFRNVAGVLVRLGPEQTADAVALQASHALDRRVTLRGLAGSEVGASERKVAGWLGGVAALVLVIGLANSALLLVVRGVRARPVMAIRAALGASQGRLRAQALTEAAVVSLVATLAALALAASLGGAMRSVLFPDLLAGGGANRAGLLAATIAGLSAFVMAAIANISQLPGAHFTLPSRGGPGGVPRRGNTMTALLLIQTTLAVLLLSGTGLLGSSFHRLKTQDFGLALDRAVVVDFEQTSAEPGDQDELFTKGLSRIAALPGVEIATPIDAIPFGGFNVPPISVPGRAEPPAVGQQLPFLTAATPELLRILGIRVVEGRPFTARDDRGAPVVLVNQTMARLVWPGESALGKCIRVGFDPDFDPSTFDPSSGPPMPSEALPCREVVGVIKDVRQRSVLPFDGEDRLMQYLVPFSQVPVPPFAQEATHIRGLLLRVDPSRPELPASIRRAIVAGRTDLPFLRVRPYSQLLDRQLRPWNLGTRLFTLLSALALGVAALGMFAAFAHTVAERRREMAIRMAIGARPGSVRTMVLREALVVAIGGVALGGVASVAAGRAMRSLLFGTAPGDPLILAGSGALMLFMAAAATFFPAHEASKADPAVLLRSE